MKYVKSDAGRAASGNAFRRADCTIIATAHAYAVPYTTAESRIRAVVPPKKNLFTKSGPPYDAFVKAYGMNWVRSWDDVLPGVSPDPVPRKKATWGEVQPHVMKGRWIIITLRHAFAVVDGTVYDVSKPPRNHTRIISVVRVLGDRTEKWEKMKAELGIS